MTFVFYRNKQTNKQTTNSPNSCARLVHCASGQVVRDFEIGLSLIWVRGCKKQTVLIESRENKRFSADNKHLIYTIRLIRCNKN